MRKNYTLLIVEIVVLMVLIGATVAIITQQYKESFVESSGEVAYATERLRNTSESMEEEINIYEKGAIYF